MQVCFKSMMGHYLNVIAICLIGQTIVDLSWGFELKGTQDCVYGSSDCNVCVQNVLDSLSRVKTNSGNLMGFNVDNDIVTVSNHWQGISRMMGGGGQYLALTTGPDDDGGTLRIVKIGGSTQGERVIFMP